MSSPSDRLIPAPPYIPAANLRVIRSGGWHWSLVSVGIAIGCLVPFYGLISEAAGGDLSGWVHLWHFTLPQAGLETIFLATSVVLLAASVGTILAWLVSVFEFPGRRIVTWALYLPLTIPVYVAAYALEDLFSTAGFSHSWTGAGFEIRSLSGAVIVFSSVLYPYVYLLVSSRFTVHSSREIESGRLLGLRPAAIFWKLALPSARPVIALGAIFTVFECLNDVGAAEYLGVSTITLSIVSAWLHRGDLSAASQLSLALLAVLVILMAVESRMNEHLLRDSTLRSNQPVSRIRLSRIKGVLSLCFCIIPLTIGFILPAATVLMRTISQFDMTQLGDLLPIIANTVLLSTLVTMFVIGGAISINQALLIAKPPLRYAPMIATKLLPVGFGTAGVVLAVGLLPALGLAIAFAGWISQTWLNLPRDGNWLILTGLGFLVFGISLRFLAVGNGPIRDAYRRQPRDLVRAASLLGYSHRRILRRITFPMMTPALVSGALLVFIETAKELSVTLILRPFGFDTLSTWLYSYASREQWERGGLAAMLIILISFLPLIWLARSRSLPGVDQTRPDR